MPWRALLIGDRFDLETLAEVFPSGDPYVREDERDGFFVESSAIEGLDIADVQRTADALLRNLNGIARAYDSDFRPVSLRGRFVSPNKDVHHIAVADVATMRVRAKVAAVGQVDAGPGQPSAAQPRGTRVFAAAQQDRDLADALRRLGTPDRLSWPQLFNVWEIVERANGGLPAIASRGWSSAAEIRRFRMTADNEHLAGDDARHARTKGTKPKASNPMTLAEGRALISALVAHWAESRSSDQPAQT